MRRSTNCYGEISLIFRSQKRFKKAIEKCGYALVDGVVVEPEAEVVPAAPKDAGNRGKRKSVEGGGSAKRRKKTDEDGGDNTSADHDDDDLIKDEAGAGELMGEGRAV